MRRAFGFTGFGFGAMRSEPASASALGPELWPQPDFDASTGLTLVECSISGGELVFAAADNGAARCYASPPTIQEGEEYVYEVNVTSFSTGGGTFMFQIATDATVAINAAGLYTGTLTITGASVAVLRFNDSAGLAMANITSCSIRLSS